MNCQGCSQPIVLGQSCGCHPDGAGIPVLVRPNEPSAQFGIGTFKISIDLLVHMFTTGNRHNVLIEKGLSDDSEFYDISIDRSSGAPSAIVAFRSRSFSGFKKFDIVIRDMRDQEEPAASALPLTEQIDNMPEFEGR